jgi:hypothetical protein
LGWPRCRLEVLQVLFGAWNDPFRGWACDGDRHWTPQLVREWWRDRRRVAEWIEEDLRVWSASTREDEREAAAGLIDYASYLDGELEVDLRRYVRWLEEHRSPTPDETLPRI